MKIINKCILLSIILLSVSCNKKYVRISPDFGSIRNGMDTITVLSDALAAIDVRHDYYSAKASLVLDSLILNTTSQTLSKKGYHVKTIKSPFMGSFMDTILRVPIKSMNSDSIDATVLPYVFPNKLSANELNAVKNINRKLYEMITFSKYIGDINLPLNSEIKSNLETISELINGNYAMFIFHQAGLVNADLMFILGIAQLALTGLATGGTCFAAVTKKSVFHTYIVLIELSSAKIIWSNYHAYYVAPEEALFQLAYGESNDITNYIKSDTLSYNMKKWSRFSLSHFPELTSSRYFKGYSKKRSYPSQNFFYKLPRLKYFNILKKHKNQIDSLVTNISISNEIPQWKNSDKTTDTTIKRIPLWKVEPKFDSLYHRYFRYAYFCRLRFRPLLEGKIKLTFTTDPSGKNSKINIVESTVNDPVMEYVISQVLKMIPLPNTNYRSKTANVVHEINFAKKKKWF